MATMDLSILRNILTDLHIPFKDTDKRSQLISKLKTRNIFPFNIRRVKISAAHHSGGELSWAENIHINLSPAVMIDTQTHKTTNQCKKYVVLMFRRQNDVFLTLLGRRVSTGIWYIKSVKIHWSNVINIKLTLDIPNSWYLKHVGIWSNNIIGPLDIPIRLKAKKTTRISNLDISNFSLSRTDF